MNAPFGAISLSRLKAVMATFDDRPPRTTALEQRIRIGTGFHGKWYSSQREHNLGWIVVQECQARKQGQEPNEVCASGMWNRLKCSPMMFWLAECAGLPVSVLDEAERAAVAATEINPKDGNPHGKMMRDVLPWNVVAEAIASNASAVTPEMADAQAIPAFERLIAKNAGYRHLTEWLA